MEGGMKKTSVCLLLLILCIILRLLASYSYNTEIYRENLPGEAVIKYFNFHNWPTSLWNFKNVEILLKNCSFGDRWITQKNKSSIYDLNGLLELEMLEHMPNLTDSEKPESFKEQLKVCANRNSYNVTVDTIRVGEVTNWTMVINIEEQVKQTGEYTHGGSSFYILSQEKDWSVFVCSVDDHFNGKYTAYCPIPTSNGCGEIKVYLDFCDLLAFIYPRQTVKAANQSLVVMEFCMKPEERLSEEQVRDVHSEYTGWIYRKDQWTWLTQGQHLIYYNDDQIRSCFETLKVRTLYMLGDSHMRYMFDYIMLKLGLLNETIPVKHYSFNFTNNLNFDQDLYFHWNKYSDDLAMSLKSLQKQSRVFTKQDVVVIWFGAWAVEFKGLHYLDTPDAARLLSQLREIRSNPKTQNMRIIWVNIVAFPDHKSYFRRNNYLIAQSNARLHRKLQSSLDIVEIDSFSMSYPRKTENGPCHHHYLCRAVTLNSNGREVEADWDYMTGPVGIAITQALLHSMCTLCE